MIEFFKKEPAVVLGLVEAVLALLIAFGVELTVKQIGAVWALVAAILAVVTRSSVYSPHQVAQLRAAAVPAPVNPDDEDTKP